MLKKLLDTVFIMSGVSLIVGFACIPITTTAALVSQHTPWLNQHKPALMQAVVTTNGYTLAWLIVFCFIGSTRAGQADRRSSSDSSSPEQDSVEQQTELQIIQDCLFNLIRNPDVEGETLNQVIRSLQQLLDLERANDEFCSPSTSPMPCKTCQFYSGDPHLRCAVNPIGDPTECTDWEKRA